MPEHIQIEVRHLTTHGERIVIDIEASKDSQAAVKSIQVYLSADGETMPAAILDIDLRKCLELASLLTERFVPHVEVGPDGTAAGRSNMPIIAGGGGTTRSEIDNSKSRIASRLSKPSRRQAGMPHDFGTMYWRLATVPKLANHYDVPRQVVRDWIKSLRAGDATKSVRPFRR